VASTFINHQNYPLNTPSCKSTPVIKIAIPWTFMINTKKKTKGFVDEK